MNNLEKKKLLNWIGMTVGGFICMFCASKWGELYGMEQAVNMTAYLRKNGIDAFEHLDPSADSEDED